MTTVAFDLDGTLVTAGPRQSWLLRAIALAHGVALDVRDIWAAKRAGASNRDYLLQRGVAAATAERINGLWLAQVETPYWLLMDTPLPGATGALDALGAQGRRRILVTARGNARLMRQQIARLDLARRFDAVYCVTPQRAAQDKAEVLRAEGAAFFIGDAESDAVAAQAAGVPFAGVTTGQRSDDYLAARGVGHRFEALADAVAAGLAGRLD
jgi:phosphoglycolate phosphatase-like HAD superfamily hydrolase